MKVVIGRRAARHLEQIKQYIEQRNPNAAKDVVRRIHATALRLGEFPRSAGLARPNGVIYAVVPGLPYVVTYRIQSDRLEILGVFHAARHHSVRTDP